MIALIEKNGDGTVLDYRKEWYTTPGEYFDGNFYICVLVENSGKIPVSISKPGPSRPHMSLIKFDHLTKNFCDYKNGPL